MTDDLRARHALEHARLRAAARVSAFPPRPLPCVHLGPRVEFRPGCGGWTCAHHCEAGRPVAVPGGVCQTCDGYEAEGVAH